MSSSVEAIFPDGLPDSLYTVLKLEPTASTAQIKGAYRTLALVHHPDKHATKPEKEKEEHALVFQQVGFAYALLSDPKRREKYDLTGSLSEDLVDMGDEEGGWEAYFEQLFEEVTKGRLDEDKRLYQGGDEELEDLKSAYIQHEGNLPSILDSISHSNYTDEQRLVARLQPFISSGSLPTFPEWAKTLGDKNAAKERKKQGKAEEKEAEEMAKELGVWEEFYGSGAKGARKGKGKASGKVNGKGKAGDEEEEEDSGALQALILKKRQNAGSFLDNLAAKYAQPEKKTKPKGAANGKEKSKGKGKGRKRSARDEEEEEEEAEFIDDDGEEEDGPSPKKKARVGGKDVHEVLDQMDDEAWRRMQEGMFGKKGEEKAVGKAKAGKRKGK